MAKKGEVQKKDNKNLLWIVKKLLLVLLAVLTLYMLFTLFCFFGYSAAPTPAHCTFPSGFACFNDELHPNGELNFEIYQAIGHAIRITGVTCTQNSSPDYTSKANINNYASDPIIINSGETKVVSKSGTSHVVMCTDENNSKLSNGKIGFWYGNEYINLYNGRVYINYTDMKTSENKVILGLVTEGLHVHAACWEESPCSCVGGSSLLCTLFLPVLLIWFILVTYFIYEHSYLIFFKPRKA